MAGGLIFIKTLFEGAEGEIEFRLIGGGKTSQHFYPVQSVIENWPSLSARLSKVNRAGANIYYGVLPRTAKRGDAAHVQDLCHVLWTDIDSLGPEVKKNCEPFDQKRLLPSIIVNTGHGWHLYWLLKEPVPFEKAAEVMADIALLVGGDRVWDKARVLRLPDTMNTKSQPHVPCRLMKCENVAYDLSDFDWVRDIAAERRTAEQPAPPKDAPRDARPDSASTPQQSMIQADAPAGSRLQAPPYAQTIAKTLLPWWGNGHRHKMALGIAGMLRRNEIDRGRAVEIIRALAGATGDPELEDRIRAVETTYAGAGPASTTIVEDAIGKEAKKFIKQFNAILPLIPPAPILIERFPHFEIYECCPQGSVFDRYVQAAFCRTDAPVQFHLAGILALGAAVLGNQIWFYPFGARKTFATLYTMLVAQSTFCRKSTCISLIRDVANATGVKKYPSNITPEALFRAFAPDACEWAVKDNGQPNPSKPTAFKGKPEGITFHSEFSHFLDATEKNYMNDVRSLLTDFYDGLSDAGTAARQTVSQGRFYVEDPAVSILAGVTYDRLKRGTTTKDFRDGFMARFMVVCPDPDHRPRYEWMGGGWDVETFDWITTRINQMKSIAGEMKMAPDAQKILLQFQQEVDQQTIEMSGTPLAALEALVQRLPTQADKIAAIYAVDRGQVPPNLWITEQDVVLACGWCRYLMRTLAHFFTQCRPDDGNQEVRWAESVLNVARRICSRQGLHGTNVIKHRILFQGANLSSKQFEAGIETLIHQGRIYRQKTRSGRGNEYVLNEAHEGK